MKRWVNSKIDKTALDPQVSCILVGKQTHTYHKGVILWNKMQKHIYILTLDDIKFMGVSWSLRLRNKGILN